MTRRMLVCLPVLIVLAGCGGSGGAHDDLAKYLPKDAFIVATVDFDQAREETGAAKDADVLDLRFDAGHDVRGAPFQLANAASQVVPPVRQALATLKTDDPLLKAIDGTRLHAAASTQGGTPNGLVAALDTDQPFDDVAKGLTGAGWTRAGDVLTNPEAGPVKYVADAGDGVLLMTAAAIKPQTLVDHPPGGPAGLGEYFDGADTSERFFVPTKNTSCLKDVGGWQRADSRAGAFRIDVDGDADAKALDASKLGSDLDVATPKVEGARLTAPFTLTGDNPLAQPVLQAIENVAFTAAYRCA